MHTTKKRKIRSEGGVTRFSLDNGAILLRNHGAPVWVRATYSDVGEWYVVEVGYSDGAAHKFTGFSWGYSGEGCRGFSSWCEDNGVPLTDAAVMRMDNTKPGVKFDWRG